MCPGYKSTLQIITKLRPKYFGTYICATHLQTAGAVKITKNGGGKILGCLKMGAVNYVLIMSPFLRDFKEF